MTARMLALVVLLSFCASAQWIDFKTPGIPRLANGKADLSAPAPRTADGKPDLTGIWQAGRAGAAGQYGYDYDVTQDLPAGSVLPWAESVRQQRVQDFRKDSPLAHCWPVSVPFLNFRGLSSIVQTPQQIVILYESPNSPHRTIYTDGRPLPQDPNPTWLGYSVGHWEGDTLIIESNGFNDKGWLDVGGHPQTESLKLTERYRRRDFGHLELEVTFEDPKSFAKPFTLKMAKNYQPDTVLFEDVCENERDSGHLQSGVKVTSESLAKFAGMYEFAPGRQAVVTVSGEQLMVADPASPRDRLFVARSESTFSSSVSQAAIVFAKDAQGRITGFTRTGVRKDETARRIP